MTVAQAHAVNILCRHILGRSCYGDQPEPARHEVLAALQVLADPAHKRLQAGFSPARVAQAWTEPHTYEPSEAVVDAYVAMDAAVDRFEDLTEHYQRLIAAARRGL